jgi:uncharacterized protein YqeY
MLRIAYKRFSTATTNDLQLKLKEQLKQSMRQKDKLSVNVIKSVLADIVNEEKSGIEKKMGIVQLIQKGIKRRNDSIDQFRLAKRDDLAEQELLERQVLESFLPTQMTKDEIRTKVVEIQERIQANGLSDLGKMMKMLNEELDPAVAPRKTISEIAKQVLSLK